MNRKVLSAIACLSLFIPAIVYAGSEDKLLTISRYQTVSEKPSAAQIHLLSQTIQVRFPQNIQTVGAAMNYILRYSGYHLIPNTHMSQDLRSTLVMPLPAVDRNLGPMSLRSALNTLAGAAFYLLEDPLRRTVNFKVKPAYIKHGEF